MTPTRHTFPQRNARLGVAVVAGLALLLASGVGVADEAAQFRVEPARVELFPNATQQLLVSSLESSPVDLTTAVSYEVADSSVASVTPSGLVRGRAAGATLIRVKRDDRVREVEVVVRPTEAEPPVRFATDVVPVLTKLGCNSGGCHGKATGQNGFKLSLLGFEPEQDYRALVNEARGRRLFPSDPDRSLLLLKAAGQMPHGGGKRVDIGSDDYRVLRQWVARGAPRPRPDEPVLSRIELSPKQRVLTGDSRQQLLVTAHFSDGRSRDVTRQAVYQSNDVDIASVGSAGLVEAEGGNGLVAVMVRFGGKIALFYGAVPFQASPAEMSEIRGQLDGLDKRLESPIDRLLLRQWRRLSVAPSPQASDAAFIRRASIDICGTLPTREEVERYVADKRPDKRRRLIDLLLRRPEYASYFALKWAAILQNRGAGYSTSKQRRGTALFTSWIRDSIAANKPYDDFVAEILTASGGQNENPPTVWYRSVRTLPDYVESVAQAFLGVRIQCAQCHHHPFDRWSQADYYGLAAVFSRVGRKGGFADGEVPTNEIIYLKGPRTVVHPRSGQPVPPRALGGPDFALSRYDDPRQSLARWMAGGDNPFFAKALVNRMWAHFLGRGIVHPMDDARSSNPPSNPELLDALAAEFTRSGYDVKHLIRAICNSYAYQLDSNPTKYNRDDTQTFARFYPRRLTAEVLLDGLSQVLGAPTSFSGGPGAFPAGTRAIELPDENVPTHFLDVFGRPARTSACECERVDAPSLAQALELVNSAEIQKKLTAKDGYAAKLAANDKPAKENVEDVFWRVFGRPPKSDELAAAVDFVTTEKDRGEAYRSLLWSLIASNRFLFNY